MAKSDWFVRIAIHQGLLPSITRGKHLLPVSFSKTENKKKYEIKSVWIKTWNSRNKVKLSLVSLLQLCLLHFGPVFHHRWRARQIKQSGIIIGTYKRATNPTFVVALPASASDFNPVDCVIAVSGWAAVFSVLRRPRGRSRHAGDRRFHVPVRSERHWQECPFARAGQDP